MFEIKKNIIATVMQRQDDQGNAYIDIDIVNQEAFDFVCQVEKEVGRKDSLLSGYPFSDKAKKGFPINTTLCCSKCYDMDEVAKALNSWVSCE